MDDVLDLPDKDLGYLKEFVYFLEVTFLYVLKSLGPLVGSLI